MKKMAIMMMVFAVGCVACSHDDNNRDENGGNNNNVITCRDSNAQSYDIYGKCDGNVAKYCDEKSGRYAEENCAANTNGKNVCGQFEVEGEKYFGCIKGNGGSGGEANDCGSVTSNGVCVGNSLRYCESGSLVTKSCPFKCAYTDQDYADCYERCGDVDANGKCDGTSKVVYCGFAYNNPGHQDGDEVDILVELQCKKNESCGKKVNGEYDCLENSSN